jgi:hypothetical protein
MAPSYATESADDWKAIERCLNARSRIVQANLRERANEGFFNAFPGGPLICVVLSCWVVVLLATLITVAVYIIYAGLPHAPQRAQSGAVVTSYMVLLVLFVLAVLSFRATIRRHCNRTEKVIMSSREEVLTELMAPAPDAPLPPAKVVC